MATRTDKWPPGLLETAAESFKALGHPMRIRIIDLLGNGPATVSCIIEAMGLPQAVASQHLRKLHLLGLLHRKRDGNRILYSLARAEVLQVLGCLEKCLMSDSGKAGETR